MKKKNPMMNKKTHEENTNVLNSKDKIGTIIRKEQVILAIPFFSSFVVPSCAI